MRLKIDLEALDQRVICEALVERMARLIEIVGDTTQTPASREAASRELVLIGSVLLKEPNHRRGG